MRTSLLVANSGGLSLTSFTLMLTRTLVSWWWPPACIVHTVQCKIISILLHIKIQSSVKVIKATMSFLCELFVIVCVCIVIRIWHRVNGKTVNIFHLNCLSISQPLSQLFIILICKNYRRVSETSKKKKYTQTEWHSFSCSSQKCQVVPAED